MTTRLPHPNRTQARLRAGGLLAAAALLAGCGGAATGNEAAVNEDGSVDLDEVTLVVGDQRGGSRALLEAAGQLRDVPYEITWQEFTSGPPLLEALNSGSLHVGGVGNTPPLFAAAARGEFTAVQAATYGGRGDAVLVPEDSDIQSVEDLAGAKVGVAEGSSAHYHLLAQLDRAGLEYDDLDVQNLQPADALAAFTSGHLDAWVTWEPYTSQAEIQADARVLTTGRGVVNGYIFQTVSHAALDDPATRAALEDYLARIARAQVWSRTHQEEWAEAWAEETGLPEEVTLAAVRKRDVELAPIGPDVVDSEQQMADTFAAAGLLPEGLDVTGFFTDAFNDVTKGG
ncbi:ABC transporter substrate-binding protein [Nocardioides sp. GCM10027113]|uniref:ABC transporter substrate-binding protein n=1 Tax=unclassified Nocardioides TaxID=2615069 RepID=UPI00360770CA